MMGRRKGGQDQFFYSFDLDKVVPPDHLVRQIDGILDLSWVHKETTSRHSPKDRAVHPWFDRSESWHPSKAGSFAASAVIGNVVQSVAQAACS